MNLYISDLHFGHKNVILFEHRPFSDVDTMDHCLIQLWNSRVSADDDVYIVGDFCYRSGRTPDWYLRQLKGHKHLIIGNHDKATLDCKTLQSTLRALKKCSMSQPKTSRSACVIIHWQNGIRAVMDHG